MKLLCPPPISPLELASLPGPDTDTKRSAVTDGSPRFQLLLQVASQLEWPMAYTNDLYHDCRITIDNTRGDVIWIVRAEGCRILATECANAHELQYRSDEVRYWSGSHSLNWTPDGEVLARFYLVTQNAIQELSWNDAILTFKAPDS